MATLKNDLARHNLTLEDAIELALNKPLWRLWQQAELRTDGACRIMMMMMTMSSMSNMIRLTNYTNGEP